eukprot:3387699-Rhodomonas_salina.4
MLWWDSLRVMECWSRCAGGPTVTPYRPSSKKRGGTTCVRVSKLARSRTACSMSGVTTGCWAAAPGPHPEGRAWPRVQVTLKCVYTCTTATTTATSSSDSLLNVQGYKRYKPRHPCTRVSGYYPGTRYPGMPE